MTTYLLLIDNSDGDAWANLTNLGIADQRNLLRHRFESSDLVGEPAYGSIHVIDSTINDGQPTLAKVDTTRDAFDDDDYATVHINVICDDRVVHNFTYRIDGRS